MKRALSLAAVFVLALLVVPASPASAAAPVDYGDVNLSSGGSVDADHFADIWDLTAGDMTLSFTYDGYGLVDDLGGGAHAWAELGVRTAVSPYPDFNPNWFQTVWDPFTKTVPLLADQDVPIGDVTVTSDGTNLYVTYHVDPGWCMTQSHFAVATDPAGLPQTSKGNAIPGQFPYGAPYSPCQTGAVALDPIPLADIDGLVLGDTLYFAAHASVWGEETTMSVVSGTSTTANGVPAVRATEPGVGVGYPNCPPGDNDAIASLWDGNAKLLGGASPSWGGADWIWSTPYPLTPVAGEVVDFSAPISVPGLPIGGSLTITADNAYSAALNGTAVGASISAGPGFPTLLRENVGSGNQVGDWGVASQGWQLANVWPLSGLVQGANTLAITAANEYMFPDDSYLSWNNVTQSFMPGSNNVDPDGLDRCINPAGLIFKTDVSYYARSESAWGEGEGFSGKDWSMYFSITPTGTTLEGSGVWLATDYDWGMNTFDADVTPTLDLDDKLILQRKGGQGESYYNLPSTPPAPGNNHRVWWDRDGVDPWQNPATANTGGIYQIVITLHANSATTGTAYMKVRDLYQGFEVDGNWSTIELTPAGMTFNGDMTNLQVFYGLYGYGATHSVSFTDITVTQ